ncbi:MAG: hypothetical protein ABW352_24220 [Polyangiales bacterium]
MTLVVLAGCLDDLGPLPTASLDAGGIDAATLAPPPDLRFKWVGVQPRVEFGPTWIRNGDGVGELFQSEGLTGVVPLGLFLQRADVVAMQITDGGTLDAFDGGMAADASLGPGRDTAHAWFTPLALIEPMRTRKTTHLRDNLESELAFLNQEGMVVSAIDLTASYFQMTAAGEVRARSRYLASAQFVTRDVLSQWVARASESGRVVTAIGGDGRMVYVAAYARERDERRYEARVLEAGFVTLVEAARSLADDGYIITAFGQDRATLLLVGTRPVGERTKREIRALSRPSAFRLLSDGTGFAVVAWVEYSPFQEESLVILQR